MNVELATLLEHPPDGLVLRRDDAADGPAALVVRSGRPRVELAFAAIAFAAWLVSGWLALVLNLMLLGLLVGGGAQELTIGRGAVARIPLADVESCEAVAGSFNAKVRLTRKDGRRVTIFTGSRAHAAWLAELIRHALRAGGVPVPPPAMRALPGKER